MADGCIFDTPRHTEVSGGAVRRAHSPRRPALRYLGGKWKLAPWIIGHFPAHKIYIEPFGGAASVLLRKPRAYAEVYNDIDQDVVGLFKVLRDPVAALELETLLRLTPFSRVEFHDAYQCSDDLIERSRRLCVRSFMGFGSCASRADRTTGWRTGVRLDSASAARDWANYPPAIAALGARMAGVTIESRPALDVIKAYDSAGTLIYADPPYMHETRSRKTTRGAPSNGYTHELSIRDHEELLLELRTSKSMVVLSGYSCRLYNDLLCDWERIERLTHADGARPRTEIIWLNHHASAARAEASDV